MKVRQTEGNTEIERDRGRVREGYKGSRCRHNQTQRQRQCKKLRESDTRI